jgi:hypothetical protein
VAEANIERKIEEKGNERSEWRRRDWRKRARVPGCREGNKREEGRAHAPRVVVAGEKKEHASSMLPWEEDDKEEREVVKRWDGILGAPLPAENIFLYVYYQN